MQAKAEKKKNWQKFLEREKICAKIKHKKTRFLCVTFTFNSNTHFNRIQTTELINSLFCLSFYF